MSRQRTCHKKGGGALDPWWCQKKHHDKANSGVSLGRTAVTGGSHSDESISVSGSIHMNCNVPDVPTLDIDDAPVVQLSETLFWKPADQRHGSKQ